MRGPVSAKGTLRWRVEFQRWRNTRTLEYYSRSRCAVAYKRVELVGSARLRPNISDQEQVKCVQEGHRGLVNCVTHPASSPSIGCTHRRSSQRLFLEL